MTPPPRSRSFPGIRDAGGGRGHALSRAGGERAPRPDPTRSSSATPRRPGPPRSPHEGGVAAAAVSSLAATVPPNSRKRRCRLCRCEWPAHLRRGTSLRAGHLPQDLARRSAALAAP
ncbi:hypothetical protein ONE63_005938 [Megalurothrips usitatus]|uniref:Uncharacterized protein n=1 Tax=Megalurothrips usitatus TaxID=439358 RepID=A0AAV7Y0Z3_9NEOP|nr:hypothetical protein ONE63_005938 [Megalurothrips usitatus]